MKVLQKRVYLPLTGIYMHDLGMSLQSIGLAFAFAGVASIILETPSGYFSDRVSRRLSSVIAGLCGVVAMMFLVLMPSAAGIYVALLFEAAAYSFISGNGEALAHESLSELGRGNEYTSYMSKMQSISLIANAVLIALVPLTYAYNKTLPFIFGGVQFFGLFIVSLYLHDLSSAESNAKSNSKSFNFSWLKTHRVFIVFAAVYGMVDAIHVAPSAFKNLAVESFGLNPATLGIYFAVASLCGAGLGIVIHKTRALSLRTYLLIDMTLLVLSLLSLYSGSVILSIASFIVYMSFWRYRHIIYGGFILERFKTKYKATLMSVLFNAKKLNALWMTVAIGAVMDAQGYKTGFLIISVFAAALAVPFIAISLKTLNPKSKAA